MRPGPENPTFPKRLQSAPGNLTLRRCARAMAACAPNQVKLIVGNRLCRAGLSAGVPIHASAPAAEAGDHAMIDVTGYAADDAHAPLKPTQFQCDEPGANDVQIKVMFCGVCHSDIHQAKNEWGNTVYPCMPGHEIVGRAVRVDPSVTRIKVDDIVGVGCMIDSCRTCDACKSGAENYCEGPNSWLAPYNGPMLPKTKSPTSAIPLCH